MPLASRSRLSFFFYVHMRLLPRDLQVHAVRVRWSSACLRIMANALVILPSSELKAVTLARGRAHYFSVVNVLSTIEVLPSRVTVPIPTLYCLPRARRPSGRGKAVNEAGNPVTTKSTCNSGWSTFTI